MVFQSLTFTKYTHDIKKIACIVLYAGSVASSPLVATWRGSSHADEIVTSTGSALYLHFISNQGNRKSGFSINYYSTEGEQSFVISEHRFLAPLPLMVNILNNI